MPEGVTGDKKRQREARAWLVKRKISPSKIRPRDLADTSARLGKSFAEIIKLVMVLKSAGSGVGPSPVAEELAKKRKDA